jgi:hypothetical protein
VLAQSLKNTKTTHKIVVLVTKNLSTNSKGTLQRFFDEIIESNIHSHVSLSLSLYIYEISYVPIQMFSITILAIVLTFFWNVGL